MITLGKWANLFVWLYIFGSCWIQIITHWHYYQESKAERAAVTAAFALATITVLVISIGVLLK